MFLSREQTADFLQRDPDGFIGRLTPLDLEARHARSRSEYLARAARSADTWTPDEKDSLWREPRLAKEHLSGTRYDGLPWIFAKTHYEAEMPHTRQNVIFLSGYVSAATLVHEMVHVNQKMRGPVIPPGYRLSQDVFKNLRTNPDEDGKIWYKGNVPAGAYFSPRPMSLLDVKEHAMHPFEAEAYFMSDSFR
jgi:hypothetical protein